MRIQTTENIEFQNFITNTEKIIADLSSSAKKEDILGIEKIRDNFKKKTEDFYRENRKLNIGVVGQVKAGKSSFLNTLLFDGKEILPKASTPKTATLTKMEYSEENIIQIEYYSVEEWETLEENAGVDLDDELYTSSKEIVELVKKNGVDPVPYLKKGSDNIKFDTYEDLISHLNDYVGEDGKFTPIVKAVTLYLNKEEFKGLSIVDTPGLNDPIVSRTIRTKEFIELCDVVFFLSQSGSFLDSSDWNLLSAQLPQKGVKKLVLIASKYDSGIRDVLKVQDDDDIFGYDDNTADSIPKACSIIKKKLKKRAKIKIEDFIKDLRSRGLDELVDIIKQCEEPHMVSAIAYNMSKKNVEDYTSEEKNIYTALKQFSKDMQSDLQLLGNFDEIRLLFDEVIADKERILAEKSRSFIPNAIAELNTLLLSYKEKTEKRIKALEENDKEQLDEQKKIIENQMSSIKADVTTVFGELLAKLETEKAEAVKELRDTSKDYISIKDRVGTETVYDTVEVSDSKWYNPFSWGSSHLESYSYTKHYNYCIAADAIENLNKFSINASSKVADVFTEALQLKDIKRRILNVVVDNFDMGSEKYDSALVRIMVEETVNAIEIPIINIDISDAMNGIAGKFNGEITSASEKTALSTALSNALSRVYDVLINKLSSTIKNFKNELTEISNKIQNNLLSNITEEFDMLRKQCENKETEIASYKNYLVLLDKNIKTLK